jgi:hypothetical protein
MAVITEGTILNQADCNLPGWQRISDLENDGNVITGLPKKKGKHQDATNDGISDTSTYPLLDTVKEAISMHRDDHDVKAILKFNEEI